jgi:hypothetical protein
MGRKRGRSTMTKRNARLIEMLISPLWLVLLFTSWQSGASLKTVALMSGPLAVYYLCLCRARAALLDPTADHFAKTTDEDS